MTPRSAWDTIPLCASVLCLGLVVAAPAAAQQPDPAAPPLAPSTATDAPPPAAAEAPSTTAAGPREAPAPEASPAPQILPEAPAAPALDPPPTAAVALPPPPAPPPSTAALPIKFGANYFTRYELRSGDLPVIGNRPLNADTIFYRARVSLASLPLELGNGISSSVYFEPQASGAYDVGGELTDVGLDLHQGFLSLMSNTFKVDVGRFELAYGEHLVIGNVAWHQTGRAFNGGRIHIARSPESAYLDIFATLIDDGKLDGTAQRPGKSYIGSRDVYFVGAYAGLGPALGKLELDVYALSKLWFGGPLTTTAMGTMGTMGMAGEMKTVDTDPAARVTLGSRIKHDLGIVDYRVEAGIQFGAMQADAKISKVFAYQADGELGVKAGSVFRVAAHGFIASGDDPKTSKNEAWDQLYPTAHKFLGYTDVFGGRSNVAGAALHLTAAFTPTLKAAIDGHTFFRPEPAMGKKSYTGSEVDVGLAYVLAPSLSLRGLYGVFVPSKKGPFATDQLQHYVEVELAHVIK